MSGVEARLDFIKLTIVLRGATKSFSSQNNQVKEPVQVSMSMQYVRNMFAIHLYLFAKTPSTSEFMTHPTCSGCCGSLSPLIACRHYLLDDVCKSVDDYSILLYLVSTS